MSSVDTGHRQKCGACVGDVDFCINSWWFAPKDTPKAAVDGMAAALKKAMGSKRVKDFLAKTYSTDYFASGEAHRKNLAEIWERVQPLAKKAKKK